MSALLAARGDAMAACEAPWLREFREVPDDASPPLAMSGRHPRAVGSYGAECIEWAREELGVTLRWWQRLAITRQLEHDADGALVWGEVDETAPRRVGKSVRLRVVALWRLANAERIGEPQLTMLVSKDLAIGKEIQSKAWAWARSRGWPVTRLNGAQEIATPSGEDRWLLRAPNAVYGYDIGHAQVDEAWSVAPGTVADALEPAMLERLWAQLHLTSTAHVKATSLMRRRLVAALRGAPDVLLLFWGAHPDLDLSDRAAWKLASPHWSPQRLKLMTSKYEAAIAGEADPEIDDPDPVRGWASQYLNIWPSLGEGKKTLIMPSWPARAASLLPERPAALGIAADPDAVWVSVGACSTGEVPHLAPVMVERDGEAFTLRCRIDVDQDFTVQQVARIQRETGCMVSLDRKGPAGFLEKHLVKAGVTVTAGGLDDNVQACNDLDADVKAGRVTQSGATELDEAVEAAGWRKVGERRVFARRAGEISMLEAVAWARWGARQGSNYDVTDSFL